MIPLPMSARTSFLPWDIVLRGLLTVKSSAHSFSNAATFLCRSPSASATSSLLISFPARYSVSSSDLRPDWARRRSRLLQVESISRVLLFVPHDLRHTAKRHNYSRSRRRSMLAASVSRSGATLKTQNAGAEATIARAARSCFVLRSASVRCDAHEAVYHAAGADEWRGRTGHSSRW